MKGRLLAGACAIVIGPSVVLGIPAPSVKAGQANAPAAPVESGEASALQEAKASGKSVEVLSERTEWSDVTANPDGTLTSRVSPVPVRARSSDGGWAPIDTTLRVSADGSVAPVSTVNGLTFSGGGDDRLAQISQDGKRMMLRWPTNLPKPALSGNVAVYTGVFPGVDLELRAGAIGFSHLLVVRTPEAARNPDVAKLKFKTEMSGLSLNANGKVSYRPLMVRAHRCSSPRHRGCGIQRLLPYGLVSRWRG